MTFTSSHRGKGWCREDNRTNRQMRYGRCVSESHTAPQGHDIGEVRQWSFLTDGRYGRLNVKWTCRLKDYVYIPFYSQKTRDFAISNGRHDILGSNGKLECLVLTCKSKHVCRIELEPTSGYFSMSSLDISICSRVSLERVYQVLLNVTVDENASTGLARLNLRILSPQLRGLGN